MEIIVGNIRPPVSQPEKSQNYDTTTIEAEILHVRPPRKGISGPSGAERREKKTNDPRTGKVLTLMITDGVKLPQDLETSQYKVLLRFLKK